MNRIVSLSGHSRLCSRWVQNMNILEAKNYFHDLISAAKKYCADHTPLPFILGACFIDYFCKMVEGEDKKKPDTKVL